MARPPSKTRRETDALGVVLVPADRLWGAQTERARHNFPIGVDRFRWGRPVLRALGLVKKCAALANAELDELPAPTAERIARAADEVIAGTLDAEFPLVVFQTGSGTQTNMNANEVIARRAMGLAGDAGGSIHPNDDVNRGQSSNDVFPTVMHVATVAELDGRLVPAVTHLHATLLAQARVHVDVVMVGRTHCQDATPITLGQIVSGWAAQLEDGLAGIAAARAALLRLPIGATAVGTGLNAHPRFGQVVVRRLASETGTPFVPAPNPFAALSAHDAMVGISAALRTLAGALMKIANDVRWYASGPRAGIAELLIPENEPGSSIMPGKTNPTQCEALTMVAAQVFGNDLTVAFAGSQGAFQLNVYKPVILHNVLESIALLADAVASFDARCIAGMAPNRGPIRRHLADSLMLVTALAPHIGYEHAAEIARRALQDELPLREAALRSGHVTADQFDAWVRPQDMTHPRPRKG